MKDKRLYLSQYLRALSHGDSLGGGYDFSAEIIDNRDMLIRGCKRILKYTSDEMILEAKRFNISVVGERLECLTYHTEGIEISGEIHGINFIFGG